MRKDSTISKRLKSYSALAGATLAGVAANGQIVYHDIEPDVIIDEPGEYLDLDLNQDGIIDFTAKYENVNVSSYTDYNNNILTDFRKGPVIEKFGKNNRLMGKNWGKSTGRVYKLDDSAAISNYGKFHSKKIGILRNNYGKAINGVPYSGINTNGYFDSVSDGYIGLKFRVKNAEHLGWIRVDVIPDEKDENFTLRIKDYGYQSIPGMPILAGVKMSDTLKAPTNIVATDDSNSYTSADCKVTFNASVDDTKASEYGVVVVKSADADGITLQDLIDSEGGNPTTITAVNNATYSANLGLGAKDIDGDAVKMGVAYKLLVYVVDNDGVYVPSWSLSNEFTLSQTDGVATNIVAADIADNGDASDMQVSFDKASDETNIENYRVMIVRENYLDNFDSTAAAAVVAANYTELAPTGGNLQVTLAGTAKDYLGNTISQNAEYYAFVVSELKLGAGFIVSTASNGVVLKAYAPKITVISSYDVGNTGTGNDIEIRYDIPEHDTAFNGAGFILAPKSEIDGWTDEQIMNLQWINVESSGKPKAAAVVGKDTVRVSAGATTSLGRKIEEGILYSIYPVSRYTGGANTNSLGTATEIMLKSPIGAFENVFAVNVDTKFTPADWKILISIPEKDINVEDYRIMAVKSSEAASFDLSAAEAVVAENYVVVKPTGKNLEEIMPVDLKDVDGAAIESNLEYNFFVLALGNAMAEANSLSEATNTVSLVKSSGIQEYAEAESKIYFAEGVINLEIPGITQAADIIVSSLNGSIVYNGRLEIGQNQINASYMNAGVYIINLRSSELVITRKIIVK